MTNREEEEESQGEHVVESNQWVIQCKRHKQLGPGQVQKIVSAFKGDESVYGYILAAPVNFSKKSYDVFRDEIRKKGITECYLWGRAELEDFLLMPKFDHILFTFFGISLSTRRRTRDSRAKFKVNNKNKLFRVLGDGRGITSINASLLLRDINDSDYPWQGKYKDFEKRPRWDLVIADDYDPRGLIVHIHKYYAYFDKETDEFDFAQQVEFLNKLPEFRQVRDHETIEQQERLEDYFRHLPRKHQAFYRVEGLLPWEDMLLIDDKGDSIHQCPHIYVDWQNGSALVPRQRLIIQQGKEELLVEDHFTRASVFPKTLPRVKKLKLYKSKEIHLNADTQKLFSERHEIANTLFDIDKKYKSIKARDVVPVADVNVYDEPLYFEITHRYATTVKEYESGCQDPRSRVIIETQVGKVLKDKETIEVLECRRVSKWELES